MTDDITIYINPCKVHSDHKKYNAIVLRIMEESGLKYNLHMPQERSHGLMQVKVHFENGDDEKHKAIGKDLGSKLEGKGIEIKRILNFRGKPIL